MSYHPCDEVLWMQRGIMAFDPLKELTVSCEYRLSINCNIDIIDLGHGGLCKGQ